MNWWSTEGKKLLESFKVATKSSGNSFFFGNQPIKRLAIKVVLVPPSTHDHIKTYVISGKSCLKSVFSNPFKHKIWWSFYVSILTQTKMCLNLKVLLENHLRQYYVVPKSNQKYTNVEWWSLLSFVAVDATCSDFDFGTALHIAASNLCTSAVKCLLELGANPAFRVSYIFSFQCNFDQMNFLIPKRCQKTLNSVT